MKKHIAAIGLGIILGSRLAASAQDFFTYSGGNGTPLALTLNRDLQFTLSDTVSVPYGIGFSITNAFSSLQSPGGYVINILSGLNLSDSMGALSISMENVGVPLAPPAPDNTAGLSDTTFYLFFQFPVAPEQLPAGDVITLTAGSAVTVSNIPLPTPVLPSGAGVIVHDGMADQLAVIPAPAPEPATLALAGLGLAGGAIFRRRKR